MLARGNGDPGVAFQEDLRPRWRRNRKVPGAADRWAPEPPRKPGRVKYSDLCRRTERMLSLPLDAMAILIIAMMLWPRKHRPGGSAVIEGSNKACQATSLDLSRGGRPLLIGKVVIIFGSFVDLGLAAGPVVARVGAGLHFPVRGPWSGVVGLIGRSGRLR
jgi:hypothetical protein